MARVLIIDDDPHIARTLEIMLSGDGHTVFTAGSGEVGMALLDREPVDLALIDLQLPGMSGSECLRTIRDRHRNVIVVIITAFGTIEAAVESMKEGAFDFLTKPFSPEQVRLRIFQAERFLALEREVVGLRRRLSDLPFQNEFGSQNPLVLHLLETARDVATSDATMLVTGESGTGKSLLARLVHDASKRSDKPFVTVDCTSFQESLLESELFGHARGTFTGAVADKPGKVELADGGTLFLDEIGEVPLHLQSKLLRLVEEQRYERLGDPTPRRLDVRIIAATNRDLPDLVRSKEFREDLFYRLGVIELTLPPLRNRPEDILLLTRRFVDEFCRVHGKMIEGWAKEVEMVLLRYSWPGNVRELAHAIESSVLMTPGRIIRTEHLPRRLRDDPIRDDDGEPIRTLAEEEERHVRRVLSRSASLDEAARLLGINVSTLWRKRKKLGI